MTSMGRAIYYRSTAVNVLINGIHRADVKNKGSIFRWRTVHIAFDDGVCGRSRNVRPQGSYKRCHSDQFKFRLLSYSCSLVYGIVDVVLVTIKVPVFAREAL